MLKKTMWVLGIFVQAVKKLAIKSIKRKFKEYNMDKDSIKIMEVYKSQLVDDKPYDPRFTKPQAPKPEGVSTMQLDDFLQKNKKDKSSTDLVKAYFAQVSKILQGSDNTLKINVLLALYSFAELSGYREGLAEGRNIAHDSGKFIQDLHKESTKTDDTVLTEATHQCDKCNKPMGKHHNEEKAKKGYKYCQKCDRTYSPEATTKINGKGISAPSIKKD